MTKKETLLAIASYCDDGAEVNGVGKLASPTWCYLGALSQLHLKLIEKGKRIFFSFYSGNAPKKDEPVWGAWLKNALLEFGFNSTEFSVSDRPVKEEEGYVVEFGLDIKWNEWEKLAKNKKKKVQALYNKLVQFIKEKWPAGGKQEENITFMQWNETHSKQWHEYLKRRHLNVTNEKSEHECRNSDARNLIFFGAPGTGKSFKLNEQVKERFTVKGKDDKVDERYERVTFYPTYSHAQFVGCYKPVMIPSSNKKNVKDTEEGEIAYKFIPGPVLRILVKALKSFAPPQNASREQLKNWVRATQDLHPSKREVAKKTGIPHQNWLNKAPLRELLEKHPQDDYCLVIEEINRANAAAVFGDVFQLLDRRDNGESEYDIAVSEDVKKYLQEEFKDYSPSEEDNSTESKKRNPLTFLKVAFKKDAKGKDTKEWESCRLRIPSNMYIWATMNSADQGVFPMDTAFKRRWEFEYVDINNGKDDCQNWKIGDTGIKWNVFRTAINKLLSDNGVNEDKLMGVHFVKAQENSGAKTVPERMFESKVLMYLWEDAARMCRKKVFIDDVSTFSSLITKWKDENVAVFKFPDEVKKTLKVVSEEKNPARQVLQI